VSAPEQPRWGDDAASGAPPTWPVTAVAPFAPARARYLPGLDGLRAVSVVAVMLYHADVRSVPGGFLGVEVFFAISGYLITSLLLAEHRRALRIDLLGFWGRRARRLLPALYVFLAAVITYTLLFVDDALARLRGDVVASLLYVTNWWLIAEHRSYFEEAGRPPLLRHLWSLAIEEQFYLLWPVVFALLIARLPKRWIFGLLVATAATSAVVMAILFEPYADPSRVYYGADTRLSGLLLGAALAFLWAPQRLRGKPGRGAGVVVDVIGLGGAVLLVWAFHTVNEFDPFVYRGGFVLVDVATLLLIIAVAHPKSTLARLLGLQPLRWLGQRSYGIYLWHWPVFMLTRPELDVDLDGWPLLALRFSITLVLAGLSYQLVERPVREGALGRALRRAWGWRAAWPDRLSVAGAGLSLAALAVVLGIALATVEPDPATEFVIGGSPVVVPTTPTTAPVSTTASGSETTKPALESGTTVPSDSAATASTAVAGATTVPTTPPPTPIAVLAVGDSVMAGARPFLEAAIPGVVVDAVVSRQFVDADDVLAGYRDAGLLGGVVVLHLGTNGPFDDSHFDDIMRVIGERRVVVINSRVPRSWEGLVNDRLASGVARWPNATLVNWHDVAGGDSANFVNDGFHLTQQGGVLYGATVAAAVSPPGTSAPTTTTSTTTTTTAPTTTTVEPTTTTVPPDTTTTTVAPALAPVP
jgi:peptidoglycan/LPS O-acetylase OafA/YrhL